MQFYLKSSIIGEPFIFMFDFENAVGWEKLQIILIQYLFDMKIAIISVVILALISSTQAAWQPSHLLKGQAVGLINKGIIKIVTDGALGFTDQGEATKLQTDLAQGEDSKRTMSIISDLTTNQLFSLLKLKDPFCDKNSDGFVSGDELPCLNKIWKYFVPK